MAILAHLISTACSFNFHHLDTRCYATEQSSAPTRLVNPLQRTARYLFHVAFVASTAQSLKILPAAVQRHGLVLLFKHEKNHCLSFVMPHLRIPLVIKSYKSDSF